MLDPETRRRPILVLGIDRSGTSLVSEILYRWGAHPGNPRHLPDPDVGNPQGYWEYGPMQDFVTELINATGRSVWDPEFRSLMKRQAADPKLRRRALALAAEMEHPDGPWFWKEPDFVFSLPFWTEMFTDPVYLITLRNPCDSATSYKKLVLPSMLHDKIKLTGYFFLRWQYFMLYIFEELRHYENKLLISYENLVAFPREQCERICRFLSAAYRLPDGCNPGKVTRIAQTINHKLWRNNRGGSFLEAADASGAQKELYSFLNSRLDADVKDFDPALYPLPQLGQEYMENFTIFGWLLKNL
jgi:hypothetical protein